VYRKEKWGFALRAGEEVITANTSANRTEFMSPPTPISTLASPAQLNAIGLKSYHPHTPVDITLFEQELSSHPNKPLVEWAVAGLRFGIRTGFSGDRAGYEHSNLKSASERPEPLQENIAKELRLGRLLGPLQSPPVHAKISPLGIVPKPRSDKFRTIYHLSYPYGTSVNDGQYHEDLHTEYDLIRVTLEWIRFYASRNLARLVLGRKSKTRLCCLVLVLPGLD